MEKTAKEICPHNALRKSKHVYEFNAYVCGNCAQIFEVEEHQEMPPEKPQPLGSESKTPWGLRGRQA